jgi:small subunit ribosomal protein S6
MRVVPKIAYEGLFLFPQSANVDLKSAVEFLKDILGKQGAEIIALKKWGDRQLAFPIKKQKRGVYLLCYFNCPTDKVNTIDRALNLSEALLRHMIVRADHLSVDEMKASDGQLDLLIEANLRAAAVAPVTPVPTVPAEV